MPQEARLFARCLIIDLRQLHFLRKATNRSAAVPRLPILTSPDYISHISVVSFREAVRDRDTSKDMAMLGKLSVSSPISCQGVTQRKHLPS